MIEKKKDMIERKKHIIKFIKEQVHSANAKGVVLGLSGGLDSAVVALLCKEALGKDKVFCVMMPCDCNAKDTQIARDFAIKYKFPYVVIDISGIALNFRNLLWGPGMGNTNILGGNLKARIRMTTLYWFANARNSIVIGTGNRSEEMMGYFTKYGDGGVDCLPIGNLYKTEVKRLAKLIGVPQAIIKRPPSAGLWEGQTDEDEMGITYDNLDKILELETERLSPFREYIPALNPSDANYKKVKASYFKSAHKRRMPPIEGE